jgi:hypothetical protein
MISDARKISRSISPLACDETLIAIEVVSSEAANERFGSQAGGGPGFRSFRNGDRLSSLAYTRH